MNWLDIGIGLVAIAAVMRGIQLGFVRQVCSAAGFFGGLFLGLWLEGQFIHWAHTPMARAALSVAIIFGTAFVLLAAGEYVGAFLKSHLELLRIDKVDRLLGSLAATLTILLAIWLGVHIFSSIPSPAWQRQVQQSRIIAAINRVMPPAPSVIAQLSHFIDPNGIPRVFTGLEPDPADQPVTIPDMGALTPAVRQAAPSVVKIEGEGCGGIVEGSGFVAADNMVVTNAHVVAGVASPKVIDGNGRHRTAVAWFDPDLDIAVLRSSNLSGKPLPLKSVTAPAGTPTAVLGYPGGGAFRADPAAVIDTFMARGRNIYDQGDTIRQVYSLRADIISGNSGGPLIDSDGNVIGVIFAHSVNYDRVGYALTMEQTLDRLEHAQRSNTTVGTGSCTQR